MSKPTTEPVPHDLTAVAKFGRITIFATAEGLLKRGKTGKAKPPGEVLGELPKGQARRVRKNADAAGLTGVASAKRQPALVGAR